MTKVKMTQETLFAIAGYASARVDKLQGKHTLKKDLKLTDLLHRVASRFSKILKDAGSKRWVMASTLRADGYKVSDCVALMMQKGFDLTATPEQVEELITQAKTNP